MSDRTRNLPPGWQIRPPAKRDGTNGWTTVSPDGELDGPWPTRTKAERATHAMAKGEPTPERGPAKKGAPPPPASPSEWKSISMPKERWQAFDAACERYGFGRSEGFRRILDKIDLTTLFSS